MWVYLLGGAFVIAGLLHFVRPRFYLRIMPRWLPAHQLLVLLSGLTEAVAGVLLILPSTRTLGAWLVLAHLVVFLVVHVDMLAHPQGTGRGVPKPLLWGRLALQLGLIAWAYAYT